MTDLSKTPMALEASETSGTSPPVYHFTTSAHLPRILQSGELRAMAVTPELVAHQATLRPFGAPNYAPAVELLSVTTNPQRERTATSEYGAMDSNGEPSGGEADFLDGGDLAIVRFTLEADDFAPWKEVSEANGHSAEWIRIMEKTARARGSDPRLWSARAEPLPISRVVAIHTQDIFNGRDEWRPLDKDTVNYYSFDDKPEVMGIDIGRVCFWSKQKTVHGIAAYEPVKVTRTCPESVFKATGLKNTGPKTSRVGSVAWLSNMVDVRAKSAPKLSILADVNDDPDKYIKLPPALLPKTPNARRLTTGVRFVITPDTFRRYPSDDVMTEKAELYTADMWHLPNGGEPFTIRMNYYDMGAFLDRAIDDEVDFAKVMKDRQRAQDAITGDHERWMDFDMIGEKLICASQVFRQRLPGNVNKQWCIDNASHAPDDETRKKGFDPDSRQAWWEKGNWLSNRLTRIVDEDDLSGERVPDELIAEGLLDILVLALMDGSVVQERTVREKLTPKQERSSPFRRGGSLYSPEQDVQEVTIRCPGWITRATGERGEPTGRKVKMHRRRGHVRTLHRDLPNMFTVYIQPVWINHVPGGPAPAPANYTVRA